MALDWETKCRASTTKETWRLHVGEELTFYNVEGCFGGIPQKKVVANNVSNKRDIDRVLKEHGTTWILREQGASRVSREQCTIWVSGKYSNGRVPGECGTSRVYRENRTRSRQSLVRVWYCAHVSLQVFQQICVECKKKSLTTIPIYTILKSIFYSTQDCTLYFVLNFAFRPIPFESNNCSYFGFPLDVVAFHGQLDCFILIGLLCFIFCF